MLRLGCRHRDLRQNHPQPCLSQRTSSIVEPCRSLTKQFSIFLLPPTQPSPLPSIFSHIPLTFPCSALPNFTLMHHLFASTSSLLPTSKAPWPPTASERPLLSVLTLAPTPSSSAPTKPTTFVTTSHPKPLPSNIQGPGAPPVYDPPDPTNKNLAGRLGDLQKKAEDKFREETLEYESKIEKLTASAAAVLEYSVTSIAIPTSDAGGFLEMLSTKMQPLWSMRGTERLDNGMAISLRDAEWILRMGELRQETRKAGVASSTSRGIVCEVTWTEPQANKTGDPISQDERDMMKAFLEQLLDGTGVKIGDARTVAGYTMSPPDSIDKGEAEVNNRTNWSLAELYTVLLRTRS